MGRQMKTKICTKCKQEKSLIEFGEYISTCGRGPYYQSQCIECRGKVNYHYDPDIWRNYQYQKKYGITLAQFELMLKSQNGVCAICGQPETFKGRGGKITPLSIDHDHKTMRIRGLLCRRCNSFLGHIKDDPEILEKGAAYLRKHLKRIEKALNE